MPAPLFHEQINLSNHAKLNTFLPRLNAAVHWESFRPELEAATIADHSKGGRPNIDVVLMFKILVLKFLYNMSDENTELQIRLKPSIFGNSVP